MLEASRFPGRQRSSPLREVKSICGANCCWCGAKIEIGMGPKMVHVTAGTCVRCGEHGESRMGRPLCTNRMLPLE
jgi:Zn ribbon nucleic-acid-binding protein